MAERTQLWPFHAKRARITEFAGYQMPLWYEGIISEHMAVREAVGVFDVSHMGRLLVEGPGAEGLLDMTTTNDVIGLEPGRSQYSLMCNQDGGIVDDVVVLRLAEERFLLVVNAANRAKDLAWLRGHAKGLGGQVSIADLTGQVAMIAVQGPRALDVLTAVSKAERPLRSLRWHEFTEGQVAGVSALIARMGYTGEDGFELYIWGATPGEPERALRAWEAILEAGRELGIKPCGLGARDTLRLEAGYCLYGPDINEQTTPVEARLDFAVKIEKGQFIGREAIRRQMLKGPRRLRACLKLLERGVPRQGYKVLDEVGREVGHITSGTFSPLLRRGIAMAYLPPELARPGLEVLVDLRGHRRARAEVVEPPFYDTSKYGRRRRAS